MARSRRARDQETSWRIRECIDSYSRSLRSQASERRPELSVRRSPLALLQKFSWAVFTVVPFATPRRKAWQQIHREVRSIHPEVVV